MSYIKSPGTRISSWKFWILAHFEGISTHSRKQTRPEVDASSLAVELYELFERYVNDIVGLDKALSPRIRDRALNHSNG